MPAQTASHPSSPVSRVPISLAKVCSVVLVFVAMLAAACVPMQVSWLWLLLPLVFLVYLDASSTGAFVVSALTSPSLLLFYGGLLAVAVTFEFGGLHRHASGPANVAASGSSCGCGAGEKKPIVANGASAMPSVNAPPRSFPVSASQRPSPTMRPVTPGAPAARSSATAMPLRKASPFTPGTNAPATTPGLANGAGPVPAASVAPPTIHAARKSGPPSAVSPSVENGTAVRPATALPAVPAPAPGPVSAPVPASSPAPPLPSAPATNPK
jgi:hypothetical protein